MLMIVVGTIGMASMTTLLSTRTRFVMDMEHSIQRRVALRNCRALVHYYFMRQGIAAAAPGGTLTLPNNWGTVEIPVTTTSPLGSLQEFSLINFLSPGLDHGFTQNVTATVHQPIPYDDAGGIISTPFNVQLKSRSPLLTGTLLVLHKPMVDIGQETDVQGSIHVNGHSLLWEDTDLTGDVANFRTRTYDHPDMITENIRNLSGNHISPTNFPFYLRSTGYTDVSDTGAPVLDGRFNMMQLDDPASQDPDGIKKKNTLHYKMVTNSSPMYVDGTYNVTVGPVKGDEVGGERRITIDLDDPGLSPVIIEDGVYHLHLKGYIDSATGDDDPPGFILARSAELKTLTLENENYRRVVLGIEGNNQTVSVSTVNATEWRILMTATQAPLALDLVDGAGVANTLALQGGVRTDSRLSVTTGTLVLNREYNPDTLELMDPREAWIEIYSDL